MARLDDHFYMFWLPLYADELYYNLPLAGARRTLPDCLFGFCAPNLSLVFRVMSSPFFSQAVRWTVIVLCHDADPLTFLPLFGQVLPFATLYFQPH